MGMSSKQVESLKSALNVELCDIPENVDYFLESTNSSGDAVIARILLRRIVKIRAILRGYGISIPESEVKE